MTVDQLPAPTLTRYALSKVPAVTAAFWITKVLTTGMGEAASDLLAHTLPPEVAVGIGGVGLCAALALQFAVRRYVAWVYWLAVVMVSVFGTMAADVIHVALKVPYGSSTAFFLLVLGVTFLVWYRVEGTLSIHSIVTRRREAFYWMTVLTTFALGTAAGDLTAATWRLGYLLSAVLFAVVIAVPAIAHGRFGLGAVTAFWFAYVITRPLGASLADWMAVPPSRGGLDLGFGPVTAAWTLLIIGFVTYLSIARSAGPSRSPAARS